LSRIVTQGAGRLEAEPGEHGEGRFPGLRLVDGRLAQAEAELLAPALLQDQAGERSGEGRPEAQQRRAGGRLRLSG
jgi:hypothetical protein